MYTVQADRQVVPKIFKEGSMITNYEEMITKDEKIYTSVQGNHNSIEYVYVYSPGRATGEEGLFWSYWAIYIYIYMSTFAKKSTNRNWITITRSFSYAL